MEPLQRALKEVIGAKSFGQTLGEELEDALVEEDVEEELEVIPPETELVAVEEEASVELSFDEDEARLVFGEDVFCEESLTQRGVKLPRTMPKPPTARRAISQTGRCRGWGAISFWGKGAWRS